MFHLTPNMFRILIILSKSEVWPQFLEEFKKIRDLKVEEAIHFDPAENDFNARDRQNLFRGMAVACDVFFQSFSDPIKLLEEVQIIEKQAALQKEQNPF